MNINRNKKQQMIADKVNDLLHVHKELKSPINVKRLAKKIKLNVMFEELEEEISGFLLIEGKESSVVVNKCHPLNRQRFTIAHEIAHFLLHAGDGKSFFIDRPVYFRNVASKSGENLEEIEANYFAAELLMPEALLEDQLEKYGDDLSEDNVKELAKVFKVSEQAMGYRLTKLNILKSL